MKANQLIPAILIAIAVTGCKKTDETPAPGPALDINYLHGGYTKGWKLFEFYYNGTLIPTPPSALDNIFVFNANGTGVSIFGEVDNTAGDTIKCDNFVWSCHGDSLYYDETVNPTGKSTSRIMTLTNELLVYQFIMSASDIAKVVCVPIVTPNPNAGTQNKALTHGLSKFWKFREALKDGQPYTIPEWRKDDLFMFNTDGTGYFTFGENVEFPGDTTNNDHFLWQFSNNYTRLEVDEFSHGHFVMEDYDIVTLNDSLFIYEGDLVEQGVLHHFKITRVPWLK